jgi:outer membrane receptor for ferrienterochelin and colicin
MLCSLPGPTRFVLAARASLALRIAAIIFGLSLAALGGTDPAWAAGTITGKVTDARGGAPLPYANVVVLGTTLGSITSDDGSFTIRNVPPGAYTVQASYVGYVNASKAGIAVTEGGSAKVDFELKDEAFKAEEILVEANAPMVSKERADTHHIISGETFTELPVDDVSEAIALKAGVVAQGGELHFRGGRGGEVAYYVDGVPVRDPLGQSTVDVGTAALQSSEVITGGFEAEYGNAQSGVVNLETKEGGEQFAGQFRFYTDDFGAPDRTFTNFDRVSLGAGGPMPVTGLTWFASYEGTFTDTYLKTTEQRSRNTVLDFISLGDRQSNDIKLQGKLAYKITPNAKLTGEYLNNRVREDDYDHRWSRDGFVEVRRTVDAQGREVIEYGRFSLYQENENFIPYNAPEHTPNDDEKFDQYKVVWRHNVSNDTFYNLRMSRAGYDTERKVLNQEPWQYIQQDPFYWLDNINDESETFYVSNGDFPRYYNRDNKVYTVKNDWTMKEGKHLVKWGAQGIYNDLQVFSLRYPNELNGEGTYGQDKTAFHYYNPEGSLYLQDRWEHEGMVINAGLRYDVFSVGDQIPSGEVTDRVKTQLSPRLGIAFPISDRDVMSFTYGRYFQVPDRIYIFEDRGPLAVIRGNPDLDAETTIAYQAGVQHVFSPSVVGQFAVYFKDIFGLLTTRELVAAGSPDLVATYVNQDYASSRGFEVSMTKRFSHNFSANLDYTYGIATGVASDEEESLRNSDDLLYLPISEQYLEWDQRHTISSTMYVSDPGNWSTSFVWRYGSGFPFTPRGRFQKEIDPKDTNTDRLPSTSTLDIQGDKFFRIWGQDFTFFMQARNLLDSENIIELEPNNWPPGLTSSEDLIDYAAYYTETRRAGGAFLGEDRDADGLSDWVELNDPRVFGEGRAVRVGVGVTF